MAYGKITNASKQKFGSTRAPRGAHRVGPGSDVQPTIKRTDDPGDQTQLNTQKFGPTMAPRTSRRVGQGGAQPAIKKGKNKRTFYNNTYEAGL